MEKGWPFRKIKHDAKTGFSGAKKKKTPRNHRYESVEHAHRLFEENQPVLGGMRACRAVAGTSTTVVSRCLRLLHEERRRKYEIPHGRFILPKYLRDDPAFSLDSYNWPTFGRWEFNPHRCVGYLGDIDFFNRELIVRFDDDEDENDALDEEDELQLPNLTEDEAMEMAIGNSEVDDLAQ
jgi:hypothetical protein